MSTNNLEACGAYLTETNSSYEHKNVTSHDLWPNRFLCTSHWFWIIFFSHTNDCYICGANLIIGREIFLATTRANWHPCVPYWNWEQVNDQGDNVVTRIVGAICTSADNTLEFCGLAANHRRFSGLFDRFSTLIARHNTLIGCNSACRHNPSLDRTWLPAVHVSAMHTVSDE